MKDGGLSLSLALTSVVVPVGEVGGVGVRFAGTVEGEDEAAVAVCNFAGGVDLIVFVGAVGFEVLDFAVGGGCMP